MTNLRQIVESVRDETGIAPCILLGNGINRFYDEGQQPIGAWLDLFFQRPIVMAGLRLNADEIVLRWLFMKRQKFCRRRNLEQPKFIQLVRESEAAENAFVNLVGGQILNCPTYDDLYR